jgi:hypothetical protein
VNNWRQNFPALPIQAHLSLFCLQRSVLGEKDSKDKQKRAMQAK